MADLTAARTDIGAFADAVGCPLEPWQVDAVRLRKRITAIIAPRQSGKSRALAVLALWFAYANPGVRVLVVSAGEEAARRLLSEVRRVAAGSPLLAGSVLDETAALLTLSNGSEIRSVPASERQIRGWTVDLLLIDEAALVADDLILGAAFPTTAARPDARIVLASSATVADGAFYDHVTLGEAGSEHIDSFRWSLTDAWWIAPSVIAAARESMTPARFAAEYEGVFASGADSLFPRALLDRSTADYLLPALGELTELAGMAGVDWGATTDRTALVAVAKLTEPDGLYAVTAAHAWPSGSALDGPGGIIGQIADLPAAFERVSMETDGLGLPLSQALARRLRDRSGRPCPALEFVTTTQASKATAYSALRMLMESGRLVLPASAPELLRELLLLRVSVTQQGGERIEAGSGHDDLADALYLAAGPYRDAKDVQRTRLGDAAQRSPVPVSVDGFDGETVQTGGGLVLTRVPVPMRVTAPPAAPTFTTSPSRWRTPGTRARRRGRDTFSRLF